MQPPDFREGIKERHFAISSVRVSKQSQQQSVLGEADAVRI